ncbi:nicotinate phosphoribosyltransferase [Parasporobacterium paucivorans]|uniref:Nicotinate phosphoribosyltransferase n=1 Tax=Parasporobacterium paucivorans DSM 15970 TaxID=1122934 RepID=A0A1M6BF61_9FIRM|nr:nicotinate phosphoribosyltransferase [Parasporobacterium paucivorans]SHI47380.1 nicotinate phosphoribosyltransferase [Parasporobacterium paucivorans DSM 15970]
MSDRNLTLLTDLYELTMMQGYYKNKNRDIVVFDTFFRRNPCGSGYSIACGLEQIMEYVKKLKFTEADIDYLRSLGIFEADFLSYLKVFRFTGDIYAIPEGTVVFPKEPMVKVVAPIIEAQLLETTILNIINHQSLIATKASRVVYAAKGDGVMEFGLRRAQGPDAGTYGARAAIIAGCTGTSNVLAGRRFGVPLAGTHAHSWIMSFPDEYSAFMSYALLYPKVCVLLVDTYDTIHSGVPNAIRVFREMKEQGYELSNYGIRLDSGDLAYLSKVARHMLDAAGFTDAVISASSDLDEHLITSLKLQGAKINSWGVGTKMITSDDCPSFGGVYKLVAIRDEKTGRFVPKIKVSENSEKITNPGNKTVFRLYDKNTGKIKADLIALADETFSNEKDIKLFDPVDTWKETLLEAGEFTVKELLVPVFREGKCVYESPDVMEIREKCKEEMDTLWEETRRLVNPHKVNVDLSDTLYDMKKEILEDFPDVKMKNRVR